MRGAAQLAFSQGLFFYLIKKHARVSLYKFITVEVGAAGKLLFRLAQLLPAKVRRHAAGAKRKDGQTDCPGWHSSRCYANDENGLEMK